MKKKLILTLTLTMLLLPICSCNSDSGNKTNFDIIRNNYVELIKENTSTKSYEDKSIDDIKSNLESKTIAGKDTYYFKDIDYTFDQERSSWPAGGHLSRTKQIAVLANKTNNLELKDIALKLLYHWIYSNYRNINWWQNEIGANSNLTDIGILLFDSLDSKGKDAFRGKTYESSIYHRPSLATHEGSNLMNYLDMTLKSSAINKNNDEYNTFKKELPRIIELSSSSGKTEGYQDDGSFFQHGKQLQTDSYGLEGTGKIAKFFKVTSGLDLGIPEEKINIIYKYVVDGLSSTVHKGKFNYMGIGRAYSRVNSLKTSSAVGYSELKYVTDQIKDNSKKEKYLAFLDDVKNERSNFNGVKVFNDSKFIAANIDGIYMSFKGTSPEMTNTECVNQENELGYNLSASNNTCVMETGNEYFNISPVWNYSYLPGSTSIDFINDNNINSYVHNEKLDNALYENKLPVSVKLDDNTIDTCVYNFASSTSSLLDNQVAYSMCKTYKDVLTNRETKSPIVGSGNKMIVSCFTTLDGMCIVGSSFNLSNNNKEILDSSIKDYTLHTTVEQNLVNDNVTPSLTESNKKVVNGNVIYKALGDNDSLKLDIKDQSGTWQRNNPQLKSPKDTLTKKVMTITYNNHDSSNYSYAYSIQSKNKDDSNKVFKLASNSEVVHAVELPSGKIASCFYNKEGTFTYKDKTYSLSNEEKNSFDNSKGLFKIFND